MSVLKCCNYCTVPWCIESIGKDKRKYVCRDFRQASCLDCVYHESSSGDDFCVLLPGTTSVNRRIRASLPCCEKFSRF